MKVPILGRMSMMSYLRLVSAFLILIFEAFFRVLFVILPLKFLFKTRRTKQQKHLHDTEDFIEHWYSIINSRGYEFEAHYVTTKDDYILTLHRIPKDGPVVLLWHGFLMSSEVFVCRPDYERALPFVLSDLGYDVWLGNTSNLNQTIGGNKYSCKHRKLKVSNEKFWDFSIDELIFNDVPDSVDEILSITGKEQLTYIGFSQGTGQAFAALSMNKQLQSKINLFIALAPVMKPNGLENKTINALVNATPEVIYLLFGKKILLSSFHFWKKIFGRELFARVIDTSMWFLFDWESKGIADKAQNYRHLYSYSSVKIVVHWFQIMTSGRFQMYDDLNDRFNHERSRTVPEFRAEQITTPIALFSGKKDTLPDLDYLYNKLRPVVKVEIPGYEHLHFLWGSDIDCKVYPKLLKILKKYNN